MTAQYKTPSTKRAIWAHTTRTYSTAIRLLSRSEKRVKVSLPLQIYPFKLPPLVLPNRQHSDTLTLLDKHNNIPNFRTAFVAKTAISTVYVQPLNDTRHIGRFFFCFVLFFYCITRL